MSLVHETTDVPLACAFFIFTSFTSPHTYILTIRDEQSHPWQPGLRMSVICGAAQGERQCRSDVSVPAEGPRPGVA